LHFLTEIAMPRVLPGKPAKEKTTTRNTQTLATLLAARKIIDAELEGIDPLPEGKHQLADAQVVVEIAGAEVQQGAASTRPKYSTFPMDLAVAFLFARVPAGERTQIRSELFSMFEAIERGDEAAIAEREELEAGIEQIKKYKKETGTIDVKGSLKVAAIGNARVGKAV
jgi:hypothetical protein